MNKTTAQRPESVRYAQRLWVWIIAFEALHQILRAAALLVDPAPLYQQLREQSPQVSEGLMRAASISAIVLSLLISLCILGAVAWLAARFKRTILSIIGVYLAIRAPLVFVETQPGWIALADGITQILIGVLAVLAIIMGARKDSVEWTST